MLIGFRPTKWDILEDFRAFTVSQYPEEVATTIIIDKRFSAFLVSDVEAQLLEATRQRGRAGFIPSNDEYLPLAPECSTHEELQMGSLSPGNNFHGYDPAGSG